MTLKNKESSKDVINRGEGANRPGRKAFGWVSFPLRPQLWPAGVGGSVGGEAGSGGGYRATQQSSVLSPCSSCCFNFRSGLQ